MAATAALRVVEAHARAYRHTWRGSAISTFASPLLFLVAMGLGLGSLVDRGGGEQLLGGVGYLAFLAPGILAATTMQTGAGQSSWPVMAGMKWLKTYHAALATPITARDLVLGHLGWTTVRLAMTAVAFVAVMLLVGATGVVGGLAAIAPAVLTGLAFAAPIAAYAAWLEDDIHLTSLFRFGIMPLFLFSGTFFPITELPAALHPVAWVSPLWHGVELTRAAATPGGTAWPAIVHVAYLVAWTVLGTALTIRLFHRRLVQ